jgi:hypothetical protein
MAALTPTQIIDGLDSLTKKSVALLSPAHSINILNGPLIAIGQGPYPVTSQLAPPLALPLLTPYR